jgi:uracil-DNA glycosylase
MIEHFATLVSPALSDRSGSVFYSGRTAFSNPADLYIIGINPGGSAERQSAETIAWHTEKILTREPDDWSAYCDESWEGRQPGTWGMQPRVRHMLQLLGRDARRIPSSNLIFIRTNREKVIGGNKKQLIELCWPFHNEVIEKLKPRVILCFGQTVGKYVRNRLMAHQSAGEFVENNNRRWTSSAHLTSNGIAVITATHPSVADWTTPESDPTPLVRAMLDKR